MEWETYGNNYVESTRAMHYIMQWRPELIFEKWNIDVVFLNRFCQFSRSPNTVALLPQDNKLCTIINFLSSVSDQHFNEITHG